MEFLNEFLQSGKDAIVSQIVSHVIDPQLASYQGKLENMDLDSLNKTICLSVRFEGETSPIDVKVTYDIIEVEGKPHLKVVNLDSNRPWIALIFKDLVKREIVPTHHEIPSLALSIL